MNYNLTMTEFNTDALRAMVHHITRKYAMEPEKLGSVKLHKILWWAEVRSFRSRGEQIAGEVFHKEKFGPFSTHLNAILSELKAAGKLTIRKADQQFETDLYVGKGDPDRSVLTDDQWSILDRVAEWIVEDHSAGTISDKSHDLIWEVTGLHEEMPVPAAALQWVKPTEQDKDAMRELLDS